MRAGHTGSPLRRPASMRLLAVVAAITSGCGATGEGGPSYRTSPVERRDVVRTIEASGVLVAAEPSVVGADVEGRLVAIEVRPGDRVAEGQRLARLAAPDLAFEAAALDAAYRAAVAQRERAGASLTAARAELGRLRRLAERERASPAEVEQAEAGAKSAAAGARAAASEVAAAKARLARARQRANATEVVAPGPGVVLTVPGALGAVVGPGRPPLFELAQSLDALALEVDVDEADVGAVAVGQTARFAVPAHPARSFSARVDGVGLAARRVGGLSVYRVRLLADNEDGALRVGMTTDVRFEVARTEDALAVRDAALRFSPEGAGVAPPRSRVFVLRAGRLAEIRIRLGVEDGVYSAVVPEEGHRLEPGELVVVGRRLGALQSSQLELGGGG
ncbi:MAG: efflux RND transporter periplasmic adaptor subunit [Myxococcota bacterium]